MLSKLIIDNSMFIFFTILHLNDLEKIKTIQNDENTKWQRIGGIGISQGLQTESKFASRVDNNIYRLDIFLYLVIMYTRLNKIAKLNL